MKSLDRDRIMRHMQLAHSADEIVESVLDSLVDCESKIDSFLAQSKEKNLNFNGLARKCLFYFSCQL